mgnify:CR=1 FL=1
MQFTNVAATIFKRTQMYKLNSVIELLIFYEFNEMIISRWLSCGNALASKSIILVFTALL